MEQTLVELCATVVTAQVRGRRMTPDEIIESIRTVYKSLDDLKRADDQLHESNGQVTGVPDKLAALRRAPKQTIQKNSVMCLECGKTFRLLSNRHLKLHGLTPRDYKRKWGFPLTTPLSAQTLTALRRKIAKEKGMGKQLAEWRASRKPLTG